MRRDVIAVAIVVLAAILVLTLASTNRNREYIGGGIFSNTAKTLTKQLIDAPGNALSPSTKQSLEAISKLNTAKAADEFRKLPIEELNAIRNGTDNVAKDALKALEVKYFGKSLDEFAAKPLANLPADLAGANGKTFAQLLDADPVLAGKVSSHFARTGDMTNYYAFKTFALNSEKQLDTYVFSGAGAVKADVSLKGGLSILLASTNRKEIRAALKSKYGITHAHHLEDVLRSAGFPDDSISRAVKNMPLTRSFWQWVTGKFPNQAEKAYKDALGEAGKGKWYTDWKTKVGIGFAIVAGLVIPLSQWFWPNPNGSGGGSSNRTCDGLCELLNNPDTAVMIGGASWLSLSCCCCICCLLVIAMMGGGKKANNNFF